MTTMTTEPTLEDRIEQRDETDGRLSAWDRISVTDAELESFGTRAMESTCNQCDVATCA